MNIHSTNKRIIGKISMLILLYFSGIMYVSYATDTYSYIMLGFADGAYGMLHSNGRVVTSLAFYLCHLCGTTYEVFYYISYVLALIILIAAVYILERMARPFIQEENWRILIALLCIVNPFIIEYFMFIEKFAFALAILLEVLAAYYVTRFFQNDNWHDLLLASGTVFLAMFAYQASIGLYAILAVPFAYYYAVKKPSGAFVRYLLHLVSIGGTFLVGIVCYMLIYTYVIHADRIGVDATNLPAQAVHILYQELHALRTAYEVLPHDWMIVCSAIMALLVLVNLVRTSTRYLAGLHLVVTIAAVFVFSAAALIGNDQFNMRLLYSLASIVGVLLLDLHMVTGDMDCTSNRLWSVTQVVQRAVILVLAASTLIGFNRIYKDKYQCNYADRVRCMHIGDKINEYEAETGNHIEYIVFYSDANATMEQYPGLYADGDLNTSSFLTDWSDRNTINYVLGTDYKRAEQDPRYVEYFASQDWTELSDEQMVFDGDTLHYCIY